MARTWEVDFLQNRKPIEAEFKGSMAYKLPIASPEKLGGVKPVAKTEDMVQPVGVDAEGALWVKESSLRPDWNQTDEEAGDFIKNKPEIATDEEILEMLIQEDMFMAVTDSEGAFLSDENGNILLW